MKEFLAGLIVTLVAGGIAIALEYKEKEAKYIDVSNRNVS